MRADDRGSALVETMTIGVLLMVPVVWLVAVLADVHAATLAATSAAREAGFEGARHPSLGDADRAIDASVASALSDHGIDPSQGTVRWGPSGSWGRGEHLEVEVAIAVPVLQLPLVGSFDRPEVVVRAMHVARIDPYRSAGE